MTVREEAHRLIDAVPEDQLADAVEMLRQWASPEPGDVPGFLQDDAVRNEQ